MPGIVTIFSASQKEHILDEWVRATSRSLYRSNEFVTDSFGNDVFGCQINKLPSQSGDLIKSQSIILSWTGNLRYDQQDINSSILAQIEHSLKRGEIESILSKCEGQFQLALFDRNRRELHVASDKVSSHPLYYVWDNGSIRIVPEVLALGSLNSKKMSIRIGAIYEFLMSGHLWEDDTYLKEATRLGPGQFLTINEYGIRKGSYFSFDFDEPTSKINSKARARRLYNAIHSDLDALPAGPMVLTLSGGLDSRALLGFLRERNIDFETVSYSFGEPLAEFNDAGVAHSIAQKNNLDFHFYRADLSDGQKLTTNITETVKATGGECDVVAAQDALLGGSFYESLGERNQMLLRGDEVWGWGDYTFSREMACIENFLFTPDELPVGNKILADNVRREALDHLRSQRTKIQGALSEKSSSNDLKDFVYWRHREARLLQSMAYYRRCYIDHQAPFLYDNTLRAIQQVPVKHRIRKKHFIQMSKLYFPDLFENQGEATAYKKRTDKYSLLYQNKDMVAVMRQNLITAPPDCFQEVVNTEEIAKMFNRVIQSDGTGDTQKSEYNVKRFLNNALRKSSYLPGLVKYGLKKINKFYFPIPERTYLYRVFILSVALKQYEEI